MEEVRPIDANRLSALIAGQKVKETGVQSKAYNRALMVCKSMARNPDAAPTLDYAPVIRAHWRCDNPNFPFMGLTAYSCSRCGRQELIHAGENIYDKCPYCHCGAKMETSCKRCPSML